MLPPPANPSNGFVLAMRGRLVLHAGPRRRRRGAVVSLVVSRFGHGGSLLAIALTELGQQPTGAISALPRVTLLGEWAGPNRAGRGVEFELLATLPPRLALVGRWRASAGRVRLRGSAPALRLVGAGQLRGGRSWRLVALQCFWIGEHHAATDAGITLG
ncbi:hypothetical protein [Roseomonas sp. AR75]|uniref:hypothetical protein n=1 Tax=Roseomonas sp. AR75 TaxID=2562311 RepID=UPI0010C1064D|nr:hypothetical protein [Roseomonas sp. AR75]